MAAEQRKLLEQLMGEQMVHGMDGHATKLKITDPKACRSYLVGTCPHDLFTNTKQDLGPCPKVHSEALKNEYEAADADQKKRWNFEYDYMRDMQKHIEECNRRIDAAQRRLEKTPDEIRQTNTLLQQIDDLKQNINCGLEEVICLCNLGEVNMGVIEWHKVLVYKAQLQERQRELKALQDTSGPSGHQKLQVCDVCGAYLSRLDNDRRLADHFYGKMHLGYAQMRKTYEQLQKELKDRPPPTRHADAPPSGPREGEFGERGYGRGSYRGSYGRGSSYGSRGGYGRRW